MWNLKYDIKELTYKRLTENKLMITKGEKDERIN